MSKVVFITGTDTGVGKTVVTALLLRHLRENGVRALAMKPFCSGGRDDAELLAALQDGEVSLDEVNPFYFAKPLAPWVAVQYGKWRKQVPMNVVLDKISKLKKRCDVLVIEGSGGLLVPLGDHYTVLDLIAKVGGKVVIVAKNKLGTINHTLLSIDALQQVDTQPSALVFTESKKADFSAATNLDAIKDWVNGKKRLGVFRVPYMGEKTSSLSGIQRGEKKLKKVLAGIWKCL